MCFIAISKYRVAPQPMSCCIDATEFAYPEYKYIDTV